MKSSQIAAQLYTLRDHCQTASALAVTAQKLRAIGYQAVQVSGIGPIPEADIVCVLGDAGLVICATHEPSAKLLDDPAACIARLRALGCKLTALPFPNGLDFASEASVDAFIARLAKTAAQFRASDLILGYHNHAQEFHRLGGRTILERIYAAIPPTDLVSELDTYWVHAGGGDVLKWCEAMRGRMPFIHLKDYAVTPAGKPWFAEIGHGNLDWKRIIPEAERGGCEWFIVERDEGERDAFDSLRLSFEYLTENFVREN